MAQKRAILFSFWGVLVPSTPQAVLTKLEEFHELPGGFLCSMMNKEDGTMMRAERGQMTLSMMIPALEVELVKEAEVRGVILPSDWSVRGMVEELRAAMLDLHPSVLKTVATLRRSGFLTIVLANHWVDDTASGDAAARVLALLGTNFDLVLQSCRSGHRVPEPAMFSSALQHLGMTSQQALWVDADQDGVKAAQEAGLRAILLTDVDTALDKLSDFTGVQAVASDSPPPACRPEEMAHGYVFIRPGVRTHYVEMGSGPPVLLCHGFPESWFSWRYQIPALAAAGFRVLALDMKGYGESTEPPAVEEYSQEQLCKDLVIFLDKLTIPQVTLVGHDWGGILVWNMAQFYPERVRAVASLNSPLFPVDPAHPPAEMMKAIPQFDYQIYFQNPGVAEAELEKDLERTFKIVFTSSAERSTSPQVNTAGVCARGGLFVGLPEEIPLSAMLTEAELQFYVNQFRARGFRGPLNWYRNITNNWKWACTRPRQKLQMPALMVTTGKDAVLLPELTKGMEKMIENLSRQHLEECGHWTQMEQPAETNQILITWLKEVHLNTRGVTTET